MSFMASRSLLPSGQSEHGGGSLYCPRKVPPLRCQRRVFQPEGFRDAGAVRRIGAGAIGDMALLDVQPGIAYCARRVLEQHLALSRSHHPE
jgi:hypothetical protein